MNYLLLIHYLKIGQNFSQLSQQDYAQKKGLTKCFNTLWPLLLISSVLREKLDTLIFWEIWVCDF